MLEIKPQTDLVLLSRMLFVTRSAANLRQKAFFRGPHRSFSSGEVSRPRGAGIFQRITSFLVGAGFTAIGTQFYIFKEIQEGNKVMIRKQEELEKRISKLEG